MFLIKKKRLHVHVRQKGVGLIEVMVSALILAIGLLGVAGLQAKSLRYNQSAYLRTYATMLAYDMMDRIRSNRALAISSNIYDVNKSDAIDSSVNCQTTSANCSRTNLALYDIKQWRDNLATYLPSGQGSIDKSGTNSFLITIEFDESRNKTGTETGITILEFKSEL